MEPLLKWAGGKRQLLKELTKYINEKEINGHRFYEPFVGGGFLTFSLCNNKTIINDYNDELINVYKAVRDFPNELISALEIHEKNHSVEYYYKVRGLDRDPDFKNTSPIDRAARIIYLNKTCYNGLYRVNSSGYYNVPIGRSSSKIDIVCKNRILNISAFLRQPDVEIRCGDFEHAVNDAKKGDMIYFDPPYDYEETGFISYNVGGFNHNDLERLKRVCDTLIAKGCIVVISNNNTEFVKKLFSESNYSIHYVTTKRYMNCKNKKREEVSEVIIVGKRK